jgi:hypothetical protein
MRSLRDDFESQIGDMTKAFIIFGSRKKHILWFFRLLGIVPRIGDTVANMGGTQALFEKETLVNAIRSDEKEEVESGDLEVRYPPDANTCHICAQGRFKVVSRAL